MADFDERQENEQRPPDELAEPAVEAEAEGNDEELSLIDNFKILFGASKGFWLVNQVNFLDGIAYFGILNLLTLFINRDVGLSETWTGISVSWFTGGVTLFMFGGGFVSDKLGVRKALTLCLVGLLIGRTLLVSSPMFGGITTDVVLWAALLVMALATGIMQPTLYAGVKEFTDPRTATIGYSLLYSIMNLGIVGSTIVSPLIRQAAVGHEKAAQGGGISTMFTVYVGVTLLMLFVHLIGFTKKTEERDRVVEYAPEEKNVDGSEKSLGQKIKELPFLDSRFLFFIFILLPVRTLFAHQFLTLPDYVVRCFPDNIGARYEWFQGLNPLIIVIFVPLIAAFTRKVNIITMMIIGTSISAITTFILVPGPHLSTLILYVVIFSFGEAVWSSRFLEYVANLAPAGQVGAYMGLAGIPWFLAKFTTGFYSGSMITRFLPINGPQDSGTMWMIYGFIALISPIGLILGKRWVEKGVKQQAAAA